MLDRVSLFGIDTTLVNSERQADIVSEIAEQSGKSMFFCNVHMLMLAQEDAELAKAMRSADFVFADGVPIKWLQNKLTGGEAQVIRGYELMLAACKRASLSGEKIGLLGSTEVVMNSLVSRLTEQFEGLQIAFRDCPPFVQNELMTPAAGIEKINESGIKWLFVGLGCPKQEKWIAQHQGMLNCHILGVGAAFDWLSGTSKKPPAWMEKHGLAWFFRLMQNPKRMWHRYFKYNSKFVYKTFLLLLGRK